MFWGEGGGGEGGSSGEGVGDDGCSCYLTWLSQATSCELQAASYKLQAASCKLQAAGCRLQAAGYKLQVTGYRLQATGYKLQVTSYRLQATRGSTQCSARRRKARRDLGAIPASAVSGAQPCSCYLTWLSQAASCKLQVTSYK